MRRSRISLFVVIVTTFALGLSVGFTPARTAPARVSAASAAQRNHAGRLGRVMPFTSADGVSHPNSFWCLSFAAFSIGESTARLEFVGYHSVEAYDSGAEPIQGATKSYQITPDKWTASTHIPLPDSSQTFDVNF